MSIANYLKRVCTDTAVYWASPTADTDGSFSYDAGVEIKCLWREEIKMIRDSDGKEVVSKAAVHVLADLDNNGMLFHGELADLSVAEKADPKKRRDAYEVKLFIKTPSMNLVGEYSRKAML